MLEAVSGKFVIRHRHPTAFDAGDLISDGKGRLREFHIVS
jgi:hypothetical protein